MLGQWSPLSSCAPINPWSLLFPAHPSDQDRRTAPNPTTIVANFNQNIPISSLIAPELPPFFSLEELSVAEALEVAPVLPLVLVWPFAVEVVIVVVVVVLVLTDVVPVKDVELSVEAAVAALPVVEDDVDVGEEEVVIAAPVVPPEFPMSKAA